MPPPRSVGEQEVGTNAGGGQPHGPGQRIQGAPRGALRRRGQLLGAAEEAVQERHRLGAGVRSGPKIRGRKRQGRGGLPTSRPGLALGELPDEQVHVVEDLFWPHGHNADCDGVEVNQPAEPWVLLPAHNSVGPHEVHRRRDQGDGQLQAPMQGQIVVVLPQVLGILGQERCAGLQDCQVGPPQKPAGHLVHALGGPPVRPGNDVRRPAREGSEGKCAGHRAHQRRSLVHLGATRLPRARAPSATAAERQ
mmetsp:Transcript_52273/g.149792  ORF Transcript_52273/g.149792 Transcript_52273/m.149792 type:complete len:250 (+) Transcript_52273:368-1117(+)